MKFMKKEKQDSSTRVDELENRIAVLGKEMTVMSESIIELDRCNTALKTENDNHQIFILKQDSVYKLLKSECNDLKLKNQVLYTKICNIKTIVNNTKVEI